MDGWVDGWMKRLGARRHRCHPLVIGTPMRCSHARHARQPMHKAGRRKAMSTDAQADAGYPSKTSLPPKPWHMSSLKASWVAGHVRSAATYMAHVCACGLGGKLLRCVWNTSGTGLERGLERLRGRLALWNASKPHVNMVVSTENGIEPLPYRSKAAELYRTEPNQSSGTPILLSSFLSPSFLLLCSFFLAPRHFCLGHCTCTPDKRTTTPDKERPSESIL